MPNTALSSGRTAEKVELCMLLHGMKAGLHPLDVSAVVWGMSSLFGWGLLCCCWHVSKVVS